MRWCTDWGFRAEFPIWIQQLSACRYAVLRLCVLNPHSECRHDKHNKHYSKPCAGWSSSSVCLTVSSRTDMLQVLGSSLTQHSTLLSATETQVLIHPTSHKPADNLLITSSHSLIIQSTATFINDWEQSSDICLSFDTWWSNAYESRMEGWKVAFDSALCYCMGH